MAKTPVEEPKYACNEKIDGIKVYYYFDNNLNYEAKIWKNISFT